MNILKSTELQVFKTQGCALWIILQFKNWEKNVKRKKKTLTEKDIRNKIGIICKNENRGELFNIQNN